MFSIFDTNGIQLFYDFTYQPDAPIDFTTLTPIITPDCGSGNGSVSFNISNSSDVSFYWYPNVGTYIPANFALTDLVDQTIAIVIQDNFCGTSTLFFPVVIPDGQLSYTIDQVTPVSVCTSQTVTASGSIPGSVSGTIVVVGKNWTS